jgi:two-component system LytT family response regulator
MLRVLIVDDEKLARSALRRLLLSESDLKIVGEAENIDEALVEIKKNCPQIIFMDIELRNSNGFEIFNKLENPPIVVFVTAYAEHAVKAFSVNAIDYLLKPVSKSRLSETLNRIRKNFLISSDKSSGSKVTIELKIPGRSIIVSISDIAVLKADGDFTHVILVNQPEIMICRTLASLEKSLLYPNFLRIGRSIIVNLNCIKSLRANKRNGSEVEIVGIADNLILGLAATNRLRKALSSAVVQVSYR